MNGRRLLLCCVLAGMGCATAGTPDDGPPGGPDAAPPVTDGGMLLDRQLALVDSRVSDGAPIVVDSGMPVGCAATTTCQGVSRLGNISGDTGAQTLSAMGTGSQWFRVRATEDYDGIDGIAMTFRATLTSPPGANFNLYLYVNTGTDVVACGTPTSSATTTGSDVVNLLWGEQDLFGNGSNDDRDVTIEVRHVTGMCTAGQSWNLAMIGNQ